MCEQIVNDFRNCSFLKDANEEKKSLRGKIMSNLMIDSVLRRAEYGKFYNDMDASVQDFNQVIELCTAYPENNQRVKGSAFFNIGQIHLEKSERVEALKNFEEVERILKTCLFEKLKEKGQTEIDTN